MSPGRYELGPEVVETTYGNFEISTHQLPPTMRREIVHVFRDGLSNIVAQSLYMIPTIQKSNCNLLAMNEDSAAEKDRLLENFVNFANSVVAKFNNLGYWSDFCDPCSGLPMHSFGNVVYPEVLGLESVRKFTTTNAGVCRVALHPEWGPNMYPATIFTNAPIEVISECICEHKK